MNTTIKYIMIAIIVAGLAYYILKRTGYIEGMESKESESESKDIKSNDDDSNKHDKSTSKTMKTIIS